jgi:hypothetical protein
MVGKCKASDGRRDRRSNSDCRFLVIGVSITGCGRTDANKLAGTIERKPQPNAKK